MKNNSWKISDVTIANRVVIAPMAGISNQAFRYICKEFGAGLIYTEMVSDKALYYQNVKTLGMTQTLKEEHPLTMQIFGSDVESMAVSYTHLRVIKDLDSSINGVSILLVEDIVDTGRTLAEVKRMLLNKGCLLYTSCMG